MTHSPLTLSTLMTIGRIALVPLIAYHIYYNNLHAAAVLFLVAAATDFFDGFWARYTHTETELGRILDPLADKLLIVSITGICLIKNYIYIIEMPALYQAVRWWWLSLVAKELLMVIGAGILWRMGKSNYIKPHYSGKILMAVYVLVISLFFLALFSGKQDDYTQLIPLLTPAFWSLFCAHILVFLHYVYAVLILLYEK